MTPRLTLKAAGSSYTVFGLLLGGPAMASALLLATHPTMLSPLLMWGAAWLLAYVWLYRTRVRLYEDALEYRSLFRSRRHLYRDIERITIESGLNGPGNGLRPFVRLVIQLRPDVSARATDINLKVLSKQGIREMLAYLDERFAAMGRPDVARGLTLRGVTP